MKIRVTMKDPDTLHDAVRIAVATEVSKMQGLDDAECESVAELRTKKALEVAKKWFEYDEYLTVEIDTDAKTCVVVPR